MSHSFLLLLFMRPSIKIIARAIFHVERFNGQNARPTTMHNFIVRRRLLHASGGGGGFIIIRAHLKFKTLCGESCRYKRSKLKTKLGQQQSVKTFHYMIQVLVVIASCD